MRFLEGCWSRISAVASRFIDPGDEMNLKSNVESISKTRKNPHPIGEMTAKSGEEKAKLNTLRGLRIRD